MQTDHDHDHVPQPHVHPWRRYVAIGDSFTEGVGDPEPDSPNGLRG
jgi:lysophospholipase L1-like esterase